jgi:hypothetical protein
MKCQNGNTVLSLIVASNLGDDFVNSLSYWYHPQIFLTVDEGANI